MDKANYNPLSRREFLKYAAMSTGGVFVTVNDYAFCQSPQMSQRSLDSIPRLNLAFRINEISNNRIELYTHKADGKILKHSFRELEADFLREIAKEQQLKSIIETLAKKHHFSFDVCRSRIEQSLREFEVAKLVYYGEKMLVKVVEVENVR